MTPLLVASFLAYQRKTMLTQDANDLLGCANREALVDSRSPNRSVASPCDQCSPSTGSPARRIHVSATSKTFAPAGKSTGAGSNQSSRASFAFWIASSSVSPAEAQPGNSGKNAAQRFVSESCSTTKRNFIELIIDQNGTEQKRRLPRCRSYQQGRTRCDNQTPMNTGVEGANVGFETRSLPNLLVATLATLP